MRKGQDRFEGRKGTGAGRMIQNRMHITLDENHVYSSGGVILDDPSVTEVISAAGLMGWSPADQYYLDRGRFVHEAIALYLKGRLDESSLSEGIRPFVDSAIEYIMTTGYKAEYIELSLHDSVYGYNGTLDALPLRDWKNSGKQSWHAVQISAYYNLAKYNCLNPMLPLTVHLNANGKTAKVETYKIRTINDSYQVFLSALHIFKWRKNKGLIKEKL